VDIPPPPSPSPEDSPRPEPGPFGPPPPPPPPAASPYQTASPYGGSAPPYPQYAQYPQQPPYPQYPQYPYGRDGYWGYWGYGHPPKPGQPMGWHAPDRSTNGLAIASLVASLTCIPFVGAILGIAGLRQIRRRPQRGRGLAVTGLVLNSLGTALLALVIVLGTMGVLDEGNTRVQDLAVGDCFDTVGHSLSDYGGGARSTTVDVVPCTHDHDAETFAVFGAGADLGPSYPGVDRISRLADDRCRSAASDYLDGDDPPPGVDTYYYLPPREGWNRGDRDVICFFGRASGKLTGSVRSNGDSSDIGV
jgi:uncharacterized protein DUF4190/putative regulator of septum formation